MTLVAGYDVRVRKKIVDWWLELESKEATSAGRRDIAALAGVVQSLAGLVEPMQSRLETLEKIRFDDAEARRAEVRDRVRAQLASGMSIRHGRTAGQIWREHGLPTIKNGLQFVLIGHEWNANSRMLLESGQMHFAIGHDGDREVAPAMDCLRAQIEKRPLPTISPASVGVYTKNNCN